MPAVELVACLQGSISEQMGPVCAWRVRSRQKIGPGQCSAEHDSSAHPLERRLIANLTSGPRDYFLRPAKLDSVKAKLWEINESELSRIKIFYLCPIILKHNVVKSELFRVAHSDCVRCRICRWG